MVNIKRWADLVFSALLARMIISFSNFSRYCPPKNGVGKNASVWMIFSLSFMSTLLRTVTPISLCVCVYRYFVFFSASIAVNKYPSASSVLRGAGFTAKMINAILLSARRSIVLFSAFIANKFFRWAKLRRVFLKVNSVTLARAKHIPAIKELTVFAHNLISALGARNGCFFFLFLPPAPLPLCVCCAAFITAKISNSSPISSAWSNAFLFAAMGARYCYWHFLSPTLALLNSSRIRISITDAILTPLRSAISFSMVRASGDIEKLVFRFIFLIIPHNAVIEKLEFT